MDFSMWMISNYANAQSAILGLVVIVSCWALFRLQRRNADKLPPGPKGWPIVGNLLSLNSHVEELFAKWNKKYGPVCHLKFGSINFIILGSLEAVTEAFVKKGEVFNDRLHNTMPGFDSDSGIIFLSNGPRLKEQRRFGLSTLKMFGMGRKSLEPKILELCEDLCDELDPFAASREPVDVRPMICERISGVISQLVFDKNLPKHDEEFRTWTHVISNGTKYSGINMLTMFYPSLKIIPPFRWGAQETKRLELKGRRLMLKQIEEHKLTRDSKNPRDIIDCFMQEMEDRESNATPDDHGFNDAQLLGMVRDLFLAGTETSSTTIYWAILFLCKYPEYQSRLYSEVDAVLHQKRPSLEDGNRLSYSKAVIQETLRMRPIAPMAVPHVANKDAEIMGYHIKKGSFVAPNLYRILHDEKLWSEPEKFDPSRHLDVEGKFVKHPSLIPFSIGPRQCLGMQLANMEVMLFLVSLVQRFSFEVPSVDEIDLRGKNEIVLRPHPYKVLIKRR